MDTDALINKFESYSKILKKYFDDPGIDDLLNDLGARITVCPRGLTAEEGGEYGQLVDFMSQVAVRAKSLSPGVCDPKSAVRVSLVHELGKLGSIDEDLFVSQDSQWHRDKLGQFFKYNDKCPKMSVPHRTLFILQNYEVKLSEKEWLAVLTSQGMHYPENSFYAKSNSNLSAVIQFSRSLVNSKE